MFSFKDVARLIDHRAPRRIVNGIGDLQTASASLARGLGVELTYEPGAAHRERGDAAVDGDLLNLLDGAYTLIVLAENAREVPVLSACLRITRAEIDSVHDAVGGEFLLSGGHPLGVECNCIGDVSRHDGLDSLRYEHTTGFLADEWIGGNPQTGLRNEKVAPCNPELDSCVERRMKLTTLILLTLASAAAIAQPCEVGSYRMADGTSLDIAAPEPGKLRWRRPDGRTGVLTPQGKGRWTSTLGYTDRPDGHRVTIADCKRGEIRFDDIVGRRVPLIQIDTRFQGSGVTLAGRLTLPPGDARVPIVVLIHGAEQSSALEDYALQREFASAGIGVFAYDKRGTGSSEGRYTQNYLLLAVDAIHATREARRLAGARAERVGYQGGSQGGWVAPLAAHIEPVDFVIVSFGLAVSPLDEDREAIAFDMERAGFGPEINAKAMEVADATAKMVETNFTEGYEQLDAVKSKYGNEPWFKSVRGNFTQYLLGGTPEMWRKEGPRLLDGVPARYDPMPVLTNLDVPQLWILGGQDRDAPPRETLRRLTTLREAGRPISTAVFPNADHGMYEFETGADGERVSTHQAEGYFALMRDFIVGKPLESSYGSAVMSSRRDSPAQ